MDKEQAILALQQLEYEIRKDIQSAVSYSDIEQDQRPALPSGRLSARYLIDDMENQRTALDFAIAFMQEH